MKVLICGSRSLNNINLDNYINPYEIDIIIDGGAYGVDKLAEKYAEKWHIDNHIVTPIYGLYGRNAPLKRDKEMVDEADFVIAFWDGKSSGTKFTLDYAIETKKPYWCHVFENDD